jgi:hypothetical protein
MCTSNNATGASKMKNNNERMITSTNMGLVLPEGVSLALVDANGKILKQGKEVESEVFEAMKSEAVRFVTDGFKPLTKHDS